MTRTNCDLFTHKSSRSYLNHPVHTHTLSAVIKYTKKEQWVQIHTSSPSGALPLVSWSSVTIRICSAISTNGSTESENRRWLYGTPRPTGSYAHTVFSSDVNIGNACRFSAQVKYWIHRLGETCISVGKEMRRLGISIKTNQDRYYVKDWRCAHCTLCNKLDRPETQSMFMKRFKKTVQHCLTNMGIFCLERYSTHPNIRSKLYTKMDL
jgi:hypothetical protein